MLTTAIETESFLIAYLPQNYVRPMEMLATNIITRHDGFRMCVFRDTWMSQMHRRNPQSAFAAFHLIQLIYEMFYIHAKYSSKLRH